VCGAPNIRALGITYRVIAGFSLHAGAAAEAEQRPKLERLCRYITRPAVAIERLSLTAQGHVRYALKTAYRDGTSHVLFEPLDFLARVAALVPSPGVNLTRYHGVFAPNHRLRAHIVAAAPGTVTPHVAMNWAQRLKRVFGIDIETCERCGGAVKIIACIEDPPVIEKILAHLGLAGTGQGALPPVRAPPPSADWFE
jgi:Putative transposase